jgi:restriction system protein
LKAPPRALLFTLQKLLNEITIVQFKLPNNSLFAILLRSPWWVSLSIVLMLSLLGGFLSRENFVLFIIPAMIPFVGTGLWVGWKQWQLPSSAHVEATLVAIAAMPWREFSTLVAQAYQREGYQVKPLDGAADFVAEKAGRKSLISCKRWKAASHGIDPLRELKAVRQAQLANEAVYVTLVELPKAAGAFAEEHGIVTLNGVALAQFLRLPKEKLAS